MKRIAITGGAGQIVYSLLFRIASGELFGPREELSISLLELPQTLPVLHGVAMELQDCAFPLLKEVRVSSDPYEAFDGAQYVFLVGAKPRGPGMERKDLLIENAKIFVEQGKALNEKADRNVLTLVVGNPCNTNALIALKQAPKLDPSQFFAMTRLDQNRAQAMLAVKAKVALSEVKHMTIWGNHSSTQVPDFVNATISGRRALDVIQDRSWFENQFVPGVQKRGAEVIAARGKSSAASAAHAALESMRSIVEPTKNNDWFSVGLYFNHNPYGIKDDLIFSFPCISKGRGEIEIVRGLHWDDFLKEKIALTEKELIEERTLSKV